MGKIFRRLISIEEARKALWEAVKPRPIGVERVSLFEAYNRVLADDIVSKVDVPPFDRSLRDGYAVRSMDTAGAREDSPVVLRVVGSLEAGSDRDIYVGEGEAVYVATGAPIPGGADSVVMEEYTVRKGGYVEIYKQASPGEWIQYAGSDISMGDVILRRGTVLGVREIGVLAAIGVAEVPVYKKPLVGIISTGDEIVDVGVELGRGKIYDVNAYTIASRISRDGGEPIYYGVAADDVDVLNNLITRALSECDVVVTSGSTSVGLRDNLYTVLSSLGDSEFVFHGVEVSPGKPTIAAIIGGKLFIGLPGFPVSCLMIYDNIFSDVVRAFSGLPPAEVRHVYAAAGRVIRGRLGVKLLQPVFIRRRGDGLYFYPVYASSGAIASLELSDGYVEIGERESYVDVGEERPVKLFEDFIRPANIVLVSSHSLALDRLVNRFLSSNPNISIKLVYSGSFGGIKAIEDGYNDFAGIHILDGDTGEYNIPIVRKRDMRDVILYRGFMREFGIVVRRGNPLGIRGLEDIFREDVRFINRAQGSGTRTFLDIWLSRYAADNGVSIDYLIGRIRGYYTQARTHSSVVYHIESGKADMGIASRPSVAGRDVDFIPLGWENFDFLVSKRSLGDSLELREFLEFLGSSEAISLLRNMDGIDVPNNYMNVLLEL